MSAQVSGASVMVTGGTGSFGQAFVRELLASDEPARVIVFSRDELKQHEMRAAGFVDPRLRFFLGDVRDVDRLRRAMAGVDVVVHAAALKQVEACEYNPLEAVRTNVEGARNVIDAALDCGVERVVALGTDKAVDPVNLYGATKLVAEKLFVDANAYSGSHGTRFACTRYGNVISSRGSVLPVFAAQWAAGQPLTVTDPSMTRFVLTIERAVGFVLDVLGWMQGGEVFVPRLPAVTLPTIASAVAWPARPTLVEVGRRPGEKMHELLVSENEAHRTLDRGSHFIVFRKLPEILSAALVDGEVSSEFAERLDVSGFRALAGMGATLEAAG